MLRDICLVDLELHGVTYQQVDNAQDRQRGLIADFIGVDRLGRERCRQGSGDRSRR